MMIPPVMRICATSNGEQRVQVLIAVVHGLSQKQRQLMQQYFELLDWQGLKLPSAERRQRDSLKGFERSVEVRKDSDWTTNGGGFESNRVSDTGTGTVRQSDWRAYNATKRRG